MENLAALLQWAYDNNVRLIWKFIPDQMPSPFVVEGHVPYTKIQDKQLTEFIKRRGDTVGSACGQFLRYVKDGED